MPRSSLLVVALLVTGLTIAACSRRDGEASAETSGSPDAARIGSCDRVPSMSVCSEYAGAHLAQNEAVLSASCTKLGGTFARAACPNTAVLGSCSLVTGEVRKFYGSGQNAYDAARAAEECAGPYKGAWRPFP